MTDKVLLGLLIVAILTYIPLLVVSLPFLARDVLGVIEIVEEWKRHKKG